MKIDVFLYSDKINVPYLIGLFIIGKHLVKQGRKLNINKYDGVPNVNHEVFD